MTAVPCGPVVQDAIIHAGIASRAALKLREEVPDHLRHGHLVLQQSTALGQEARGPESTSQGLEANTVDLDLVP